MLGRQRSSCYVEFFTDIFQVLIHASFDARDQSNVVPIVFNGGGGAAAFIAAFTAAAVCSLAFACHYGILFIIYQYVFFR